jgi:hypothetical protein
MGRLNCRSSALDQSSNAPADDKVSALDRYVDRLWRVTLPWARRAAPISVRLVWLTAGLSVPAGHAAIGDYVCVLGPKEIARRAHLPLPEAADALEALVDAGRLEPLQCRPDGGTAYELSTADTERCAKWTRPERVSGKARDNGQGGASFAERLSPLIAKGGYKRGVIPVPGLLVHYQGLLGLTDGELVYILHVLDEKRGRDWPYLGVSETAREMLRHERNARSLKQSLEQKGLLVCRSMWKADGTRGGDEHDLSGLFAQLERLAIELGTQEALDQVRAEQPEPMYYLGQIQMASSPPERLRRAVRRRRRTGDVEANTATAAFTRNSGGGGENATTPLAKMPPPGRRIRRPTQRSVLRGQEKRF